MSEGFRPHLEAGADAPKKEKKSTPNRLRKGAEGVIRTFCKEFSIQGGENLEEVKKMHQERPDVTFIITSSHLSNLDAPAVVKAFGADFDLQIAVSSKQFGFTPNELMFRVAGKESFTGLDYKKNKGGGFRPQFNPENFKNLSEKIKQGKTPWVAVHNLALDGRMKRANIGAVYLAQKTKSLLIPAALEIRGGGSVSLEGIPELTKAIKARAEAVYHIGRPIQLEPIDISIIETVLTKRKRKEMPTKEEKEQFSIVTKKLHEQADTVARVIGAMLPENMRGPQISSSVD